jgi:hypothetical protein
LLIISWRTVSSISKRRQPSQQAASPCYLRHNTNNHKILRNSFCKMVKYFLCTVGFSSMAFLLLFP